MKYSISIAVVAGLVGLTACEKTTVTPVPVPQSTPSTPPATVVVPGPQGAPGPQGPAGDPGKSSTTVVTPPAGSSSSTTSSTTTTETKSEPEKK